MIDLKEKRILVTGGAGFIGSHVVDYLLAQDASVRVLDNFVNGSLENLKQHAQNSNLEIIRGSITDPTTIDTAMQDIDYVMHLACLGVRHSIKFPHENHLINAEGSLLVLEAARSHGVKRFLYCSTSEIYGTAKSVPIDENHLAAPHTVYGASKLAGENYARAYNITYQLPVVIIRPFNTFGPRSHFEGSAGEFIPKAIVRGLNNLPITIFGDGSQTRDFTYVEDTARGLVMALQTAQMVGEMANIGSNFEISLNDIAKLLNMHLDHKLIVEYGKSRPGDVLRLFANSNKFRDLTQWAPHVSFEQGIIKTIQWFKALNLSVSDINKMEQTYNWE